MIQRTYDILRDLSEAKRNELIQSGIVPVQWARYLTIYEFVLAEIRRGMARMDAYCSASEKYYTSEANVRKIVARMERPVI